MIPTPIGAFTAVDPLRSLVRLLLVPAGPVGSTAIVDRSRAPHTLTIAGNTRIDDTTPKFQGRSIFFDGNGDYIQCSHADFALGTNLFCAEGWFYFTGTPDATQEHVFQTRDGTNNGILVLRNNSGTIQAVSDSGLSVPSPAAGSATSSNWHHLALCREASNVHKFYLGGTSLGSHTTSQNYNSQNLIIGRRYAIDGSSWRYFGGRCGGFRLTVGDPRYTSNFTPPPLQFPVH